MRRTYVTNRKKLPARMGYFRVDSKTWKRLRDIANTEQLTVSDVVRRAIREYLTRAAA